MSIYAVVSNYFDHGFFGTYSTILRARKAIETFLAEDKNVVSVEDTGDYTYRFTTKAGETFSAEIVWDVLDSEFEWGMFEKEGE